MAQPYPHADANQVERTAMAASGELDAIATRISLETDADRVAAELAGHDPGVQVDEWLGQFSLVRDKVSAHLGDAGRPPSAVFHLDQLHGKLGEFRAGIEHRNANIVVCRTIDALDSIGSVLLKSAHLLLLAETALAEEGADRAQPDRMARLANLCVLAAGHACAALGVVIASAGPASHQVESVLEQMVPVCAAIRQPPGRR